MSTNTQVTGWIVQGFEAWWALWIWLLGVVLHAIGRSLTRPAPDPIRMSGPVE